MPGGDTWVPGYAVGRYVLLRELARGGMAEIWLAQQPGPKGFTREVVIKRIITNDEAPPGFEQMFFDEARLASQLSHPNIVQVFDFDEWQGAPYIVMEYLAGETLARVARELARLSRQLPIELAVSIVERCAEALGFAHRRRGTDGEPLNVVHRDVSPQNIFVTYDGVVKVLDFGIAHAMGRMTRTDTGLVKGKPAYMPPEQARGGQVTAAADVFALGVVLFELLTGRRMYEGADPLTMFARLLQGEDEFAGPAASRAEVPASLDAIVRQALARDPSKRFADGADLSAELAKWQRENRTGASERDVRDFMQKLFSERIGDLAQFLSSVRAGVIPEVTTPSKPSTMPGNTPGVTAVARPRRAPARLRIAIGVGAVLIAAAGWLFGMRSRPDAAPAAVEPKPALVAVATPKQEPSVVPPTPPAAPLPPAVEVDAGAKLEPKPAPVHAVAQRMHLSLDTTPWTRVFLGKTKLGDTPLIDVVLPSGTQTLRLINEARHIDTTIELEGRPGEHLVKNLSL